MPPASPKAQPEEILNSDYRPAISETVKEVNPPEETCDIEKSTRSVDEEKPSPDTKEIKRVSMDMPDISQDESISEIQFKEKESKQETEINRHELQEQKQMEVKKAKELERPAIQPTMEVDLTQTEDESMPATENIRNTTSEKVKPSHKVEEKENPRIYERPREEHRIKYDIKDYNYKESKYDGKTLFNISSNQKENSSLKMDEREYRRRSEHKHHSRKEGPSPPPIVILDDSERAPGNDERKNSDNELIVVSGNTTPRMDNSVETIQPATPINPGSVKQTPPQPEIPSMGVYTPDSTTNSVHSLHGYGQCDLDVSQLGLESPTSISSNDMPPSVSEPPRPPSSQPYTDCAQQGVMYHHVGSSPQHCVPVLPQYQSSSTSTKQSSSSRSKTQSVSQHHARNRSTPPAPSPTVHRSTPPQQPPSRHHQQPYSHHHPHHAVISQANYGIVPQMGQTGTYSIPMATVIQHRMSAGTQQSPNQRLGSSPSCSVSTPTNFYIQNIQTAMHPHSHTPTPTTCSGIGQSGQGGSSSCSIAKLQQLTNGLDMIPPGHCANMTPPPPMNLTPPPPPSHATMTPPPPTAHQMLQQSNLSNYHKFYQSNMPPTPSGRSSRGSSSVQMPPTGSSSRSGVSPNVTINPNLMAQYSSTFNGYRMASQQSPATVTGYITNTAGFINQSQIPVQMGVMNMAQSQYAQDPATLQQNTMYTYGYINGNLINSPLRR